MDDRVDVASQEVDLMIELIIAIMFMFIGLVGVSKMIVQLQTQTQVNSRVDKVNVSSLDSKDDYPFIFTGYQAYMFAWMMDGHVKTDLYYFGGPGAIIDNVSNMLDYSSTGCDPKASYVGLRPAKFADGFLVIRNRAIIGSSEYKDTGSVKKAIYGMSQSASSIGDTEFYRKGKVRLDLTDEHVNFITDERKDYIWSLHPVLE